MTKFQKLYLAFFYSGLSPVAPGTFGTIAALPFAYFFIYFFDNSTLFCLAILLLVASVKPINDFEKTHAHDSKNIVIDEVCGVFLAISMSFAGQWWEFALAFVFFRFFDITKLSVIGLIDRKVKGGWGVMLDDVAAGFFAGLLTLLVRGIIDKF